MKDNMTEKLKNWGTLYNIFFFFYVFPFFNSFFWFKDGKKRKISYLVSYQARPGQVKRGSQRVSKHTRCNNKITIKGQKDTQKIENKLYCIPLSCCIWWRWTRRSARVYEKMGKGSGIKKDDENQFTCKITWASCKFYVKRNKYSFNFLEFFFIFFSSLQNLVGLILMPWTSIRKLKEDKKKKQKLTQQLLFVAVVVFFYLFFYFKLKNHLAPLLMSLPLAFPVNIWSPATLIIINSD